MANIQETGAGVVNAKALTVLSKTGACCSAGANKFSSFSATNSTSGDVTLNDLIGLLSLQIIQKGQKNNIVVSDNAGINLNNGNISSNGGMVMLQPIVVFGLT